MPTTTHEDPLLKVLTWDLLLAVRWYEVPQLPSLTRFRTLQSDHFARHPGKSSIVISYSAPTGELHFDSGTRDLVLGVMADAKTHLLGMAQIVAGDGFGAASVRAVLSSIQLATRPDYPVKVFSDAHSAQPWLEELLLTANQPDLARAVGTVLLPPLESGHVAS